MEIGGLPLELWRLILAYLPLRDLGRCGLVCRSWYDLIISLDNTRWRQLCLGCAECRHPNWPIQPEVEPKSWREAFKQHYVASRTWTKNTQDLESSNCLYLFKRKKDRRVLYVGYGCEFENLRTALASANVYDRIMLQPGVYEEQNEIILKVPVEIMGQGKLGDVALLVCVDQQCPTSRLCNLVFMPAWFTPVMYKTSIGYVQFDNCNFENGQLQIHAPGMCQIKFCTFNQSSIHFHNVALSVLENCEFVNSENASVTVEGSPTSDKNWACKHLSSSTKSRTLLYTASEPSLSGNTDLSATGLPSANMRTCEILVNGDQSHSHPQSKSQIAEDNTTDKENELNGNFYMGKDGEATTLDTDYSDSELSTVSENEDDDQSVYKLSYHSHGLSHMLAKSIHCRPQTNGLLALQSDMALKSLQQELQRDKELQSVANSIQGCLVWKCLFRDGKGGVFICSQGQARLEGCIFRDLTYAVRCIQNSKIVMLKNDIHHCKASGVFLRLAAGGLIADNNIHSNTEAGVDIRKGANPIILCNRIHSGLRSGIVVLGNGKGSIRSNQIYGNKEAGIYILYNGNPVVSGNHIFQGLAAGIAVNENGRGQITENVIRENQWGGVDIRRGGDPVLRSNLICCGYSDGVVVGERGKGLIEGNTIYGNKGCGVWIMSSSLPHITSNQIGHNSIYGVAVFCRKDDASDYVANQAGNENFNDEGEAASWENDLDSEDDRFSSRRPINVALIESNSINHNGAAGLYIKSSEALNIIANAIHANHDSGVAVFQSTQLVRIGNNSISCNRLSGVHVETGCRVELRGNGIYDNRSHGIISKGDGTIVENDIIGNRGCGLQLVQTADMKVTRNRIQSLHGYGIALLDQTKSLVQENLIFQGKSGQNILQQVSNNEDCIVQHNKLLTYKKKPDVTWKLENPPPRPYIEGCTRGVSSTQSSQRVATVTTRIAARVEGRCHNNGSIFCTIL
ncbi:F-box only protein 10 [Hyla sarda]|uniref:F-box only protein 10 n=1 Tax=Hyla sarda TaxID=327740 RepID=UPI0024C283DF|nr:F-box only protein 10 [Hyla sarda]XP_056374287.1 F-box only protein 10 [Hyla sarda]XP_056374288.1 F-box only protein 10 [Hyla sarda]XP_056374289.1 F-box only protein 10 [Hyla sarda]